MTKALTVVETIHEARELASATVAEECLAFQVQLQSPDSPKAAGFFREDVELLRAVAGAVQEIKPDFCFNRCQSFKGYLGEVSKWHIDSPEDWDHPSYDDNRINLLDSHKGRFGTGVFDLVRATSKITANYKLSILLVERGHIFGIDDLNASNVRDLHDGNYFTGVSQPGRYTFFTQGSKAQGILPAWHRVETTSLLRLATSLSHDIRGPRTLTRWPRNMLGKHALSALAS